MLLGDFPPILLKVFAAIFGLVFGSFLNVVIYRLPIGMSIVTPSSHCPHCRKPIKPWNNIPIVSYLLLVGKTRCCRNVISARYPLVEALGCLYALALVELKVLSLSPSTPIVTCAGEFVIYYALGMTLIAASFIDLDHLYIPDSLTIGGIVLGLATFWMRPSLHIIHYIVASAGAFLLVWLVFGVLYRKVRGLTGMGLGDAKLLALAGAWFGLPGALFTLFAGAIQGVVAVLILVIVKGTVQQPQAVQKEKERILAEISQIQDQHLHDQAVAELEQDPLFEADDGTVGTLRVAFGPFLALAIIEYTLFGDALLEFYSFSLP